FEFEGFVTDDGDFSGNEVPGIPPHQLHGRLAWSHASGLSARVEVTAVDGFFVDNENAVRNDPYAVTDLRFAYDARVGGLAITPFLGIDNVTDERYSPSVVVNAFGGRFFEPAP
ncbi:MAG: TonB-dependent receptor, partial [Gemmatimonadetes bacterium]|nr:TonB-dependent receptor [Gemmatimonadota bacterium]NIS01067.1 TonB-dependent receptor [Gemmatimonadota bacterium]NIT69080.1 TonB-dependent receptor [Gemmatimonadota bacterium]NIU54093.1 TonB-dependent receptor [Gemmatimonadota bacterium]NIV23335.1 TonB-dependent receptor [Gemmatimonadota bacterium]